MTPLQLLLAITSLAEQHEAKHGKTPTLIYIPARYQNILNQQFSPVSDETTLNRLQRIEWMKKLTVSTRYEEISVS